MALHFMYPNPNLVAKTNLFINVSTLSFKLILIIDKFTQFVANDISVITTAAYLITPTTMIEN
jgi:hypothetical protein